MQNQVAYHAQITNYVDEVYPREDAEQMRNLGSYCLDSSRPGVGHRYSGSSFVGCPDGLVPSGPDFSLSVAA